MEVVLNRLENRKGEEPNQDFEGSYDKVPNDLTRNQKKDKVAKI